MISKELLNQVKELIELAVEVTNLNLSNVNVEFVGPCKAISVCIYSKDLGKVEYRDICYLDWKDGVRCPDVMFPEFRSKLEGLLKVKEVA